MKEKTIYICEVCGGTFSNKEVAEACEKSKLPESFNKYVGKWVIVPLQVFYHENTEASSKITSEIKWRLTRIDKNEIIGNRNMDVVSLLRLERISHKVKYHFTSFEDGCILIDGLFDQAIDVTDFNISEYLNNALVMLNRTREEPDFEHHQHMRAEEMVIDVCTMKNIHLPEIMGVEKYDFKNEVV